MLQAASLGNRVSQDKRRGMLAITYQDGSQIARAVRVNGSTNLLDDQARRQVLSTVERVRDRSDRDDSQVISCNQGQSIRMRILLKRSKTYNPD